MATTVRKGGKARAKPATSGQKVRQVSMFDRLLRTLPFSEEDIQRVFTWAVVAALAIAVIVIYPRIEPLLPEALRSNIAKITSLFGPAQNFTAQGFAAVASDVNLRAAPSTTARVIATLPRGLKVATIERRGEWTFVQVEGEGNTQPRRGWVFSSFLKEETGEVEDDDETSSGETE